MSPLCSAQGAIHSVQVPLQPTMLSTSRYAGSNERDHISRALRLWPLRTMVVGTLGCSPTLVLEVGTSWAPRLAPWESIRTQLMSDFRWRVSSKLPPATGKLSRCVVLPATHAAASCAADHKSQASYAATICVLRNCGPRRSGFNCDWPLTAPLA